MGERCKIGGKKVEIGPLGPFGQSWGSPSQQAGHVAVCITPSPPASVNECPQIKDTPGEVVVNAKINVLGAKHIHSEVYRKDGGTSTGE